MDVPQLSNHFFEILNDEHRSKQAPRQPVLQILDMRQVMSTTYRLQMSDGDHTWSSCSLIEPIVDQVLADTSNVPLTVRVLKYDTSIKINERGMSRLTFYVHEVEILERNARKIGTPTPLSNILDKRSQSGGQRNSAMDIENRNPAGRAPVSRGTPMVNYGSSSSDITPIALITPYVSKWRVCGVATQKTNLRNIKSAKGEWKVFSFTMADKNGSELRVSAFGEVAETVHGFLREGEMYYLNGSAGIVKAADKRYNSTGHDYEVTLRNQADVVLCEDRPTISAAPLKLNVTALSKLGNCQSVDILAVVERVEELVDVTVRASGNIIKKRNVQLVDDSKTMVQLVLWDEKAIQFNVGPDEHPIIGLKNVAVKEYNGSFSLSVGAGSRMEINPDCNGSDHLTNWYLTEKPNASITSLSAAGGSGGSFVRDLLTVGMASASKLGETEDRGTYFNVVAIVNNIKAENIVYKACASEGCKKKVQEMEGQYRCEKCDITRDSFKYVLMVSCELTDATGSYWVTIFEERARDLLQMTADEIGTLQSTNVEQFNQVIEQIRFRPYHFRIRAKTETFNDMQNIRWTAYDVKPVPYPEYIKTLQDTIQKLEI